MVNYTQAQLLCAKYRKTVQVLVYLNHHNFYTEAVFVLHKDHTHPHLHIHTFTIHAVIENKHIKYAKLL